MYEQGMSLGSIAAYFGVSRQAMWERLAKRVTMRPNLRFGSDNHFFRGGERHSNRAHDLVEYALRIGILTRIDVCETCGASGWMADGRSLVQAHHDNYNKPLSVRWLCQPCHHQWHATNQAVPLVAGTELPRAREC